VTGRLTILIVGGYGTFGGRLAVLLAREPRVSLIIAGRSEDKAARFIATLEPGAEKRALGFDRNDPEAALAQLAPDIVVDASGPFQVYGDDPYRLVRAAIAAGANYLDLADSSAFVGGINQFDAAAKARGVFVLSGVCSVPVLSAAVLRALSKDMSQVDTITSGISPSPHAVIGPNVIEAILSYAGKEIGVVRDGKVTTARALTETMRYTVAPPGHVPLANIRFSLVDVPDLLLIPAATPGLQTAWMGAGTRPEFLHRALNGFAWLVRLGILPSLSFLAAIVFEVQKQCRWGEHRGGMFVEVTGRGAEGTVRRSWHLLAEGDDGPFIPSMPIEALVRKMLDGQRPGPGARSAIAALELSDYDRVFAGRTLYYGFRDAAEVASPLYRHLLGAAWADLPKSLQAMHDLHGKMTARGIARVETGDGTLAGLVRRFFGFPPAGQDVAVTVDFEEHDGVETWRRDFAGHTFHSTQQAGRGRDEWLIIEQFGPVRVALAVVVEDGTLRLVTRRWSLFGIPMPLALGPTSDAHEYEANGKFHFHVELGHRWAGLIVRYSGWLLPDGN
jgi:hypothetical protein